MFDRCMDLDGDGYLSMYELEFFYEEQLQRMESLGIETLPFEDCLCQVSASLPHHFRIELIHQKNAPKNAPNHLSIIINSQNVKFQSTSRILYFRLHIHDIRSALSFQWIHFIRSLQVSFTLISGILSIFQCFFAEVNGSVSAGHRWNKTGSSG